VIGVKKTAETNKSNCWMELAMHVWSLINFGEKQTSLIEGKELRYIGCVDLPSNILP